MAGPTIADALDRGRNGFTGLRLALALAVGGSNADLGDMHVTAPMSAASPGLLLAAATGAQYAQMELVSRQFIAG